MQELLDQLVRRLRYLPTGQWPPRRAAVQALLATLAAPRPAPELPDHALADAVAVIGFEAISIAPAQGSEMAVRDALERALTATR